MIQSTIAGGGGLHVAIVMDGNGRWATARGRPRTFGHAAGAAAVPRVVEAAARRAVSTLTLYAFSGDNWRRPAGEVQTLMRIFRRFLREQTAHCVTEGIRLSVIGRRDRLAPALLQAVDAAEGATAAGRAMDLRVAIDYSARDAIVAAAARAARAGSPLLESGGAPDRAAFAALLGEACHMREAAPDVDLLVRTGGEMRASDFLLWECAYAELLFVPTPWPEFGAADLDAALRAFHARQRRFGGLPALAG